MSSFITPMQSGYRRGTTIQAAPDPDEKVRAGSRVKGGQSG
ncbi:hypothetical protein [Arthrobacter sp. D3-16]